MPVPSSPTGLAVARGACTVPLAHGGEGLAWRLRARRASGRRRRPLGRARGFSMIEMLIVIALMALLGSVAVGGTGMLSGTRMRSAAALIMNAVRMGLTRANSIGRPVRLVFDLDNERILLEETRGRMLRVTSHTEGAKAGAEAATELEQQAADYARGIVQGPRAPVASFVPVKEFVSEGDDATLGRELGSGIRFVQVQTEHDTEPRTEGRAYLYFWPGGGTERAVIQLTRPGDATGLSVVVSALTGRAKLVRGAVELEQAQQEDHEEREEP